MYSSVIRAESFTTLNKTVDGRKQQKRGLLELPAAYARLEKARTSTKRRVVKAAMNISLISTCKSL